MTLESIEKLRELAADINSNEIVDHMQLYPNCVFDGHWLDAWHREFDKLLEAIQAEVDERYMELPLDADGVPIHVGDVMTLRHKKTCEVVAVSETQFTGKKLGSENCVCHANLHSHVKPRTVEDVLRDFFRESRDFNLKRDGELEDAISRYSSELRMRDVDGE